MIIQKSDIIARLGNKMKDIPLEDIKTGVNLLLSHMREALCEKRTIAVRGFGTFKLQHHDARPLYNPKKNMMENIAARDVPRFKPALSVAKRLKLAS